MLFEELSYREDGLPVAVPFHPRLTMVGPLGVRGRSGWIGRALGVLLGTRSGDGTSLTLCDQAGCHLRLDRDGHGAARLMDIGTGEDLTPAAADLPLDGRYDWFASLGLDSRSADALARVTSSDFKGADVDQWAVEDQLVEARVALARLEAEYEMVVGRCRHAGELYRRVEELDEWLGRMEEERARRRYGEALQTVRRLEADVAILRQTAASEQQTAEAILAAAVAGQEWQRATEALEVARLACRELGLPETECPSTPAPALPGVASTGGGAGPGTLADELEVAHRALEEAERELDRARLPGAALIARRRLARADRREQAVLEQMGCTSWLAFQMQRVAVLREEEDDDGGAELPVPGEDPDAAPDEARTDALRAARRRRTLEEATSACRTARVRLEELLVPLGLLPAGGDLVDLAPLVAAMVDRASEAALHQRIPPSSRSVARAEAELSEARTALAAHSRPEWDGHPVTTDEPVPDAGPLLEERARLFEEALRMEQSLPDIGRIHDEREVLARHIATLEAASRLGYQLTSIQEAEMILLGRVADARRVGPGNESIPLLVDDAFAAFPVEDRADLFDLLSRLAETIQIVYLTDDPLALEWASGRAGDGEVLVVRPAGPPPAVASVA